MKNKQNTILLLVIWMLVLALSMSGCTASRSSQEISEDKSTIEVDSSIINWQNSTENAGLSSINVENETTQSDDDIINLVEIEETTPDDTVVPSFLTSVADIGNISISGNITLPDEADNQKMDVLGSLSALSQNVSGNSLTINLQPESIQANRNENMPSQLSIDDIAAMNSNNCLITYSDEGYISTLIGTFYEGTIANQEDAIESIKGIAGLLGLGAGCEFFCVYGARDKAGYTYYTFQQRYGGYTLQYATMVIIVDPQGHAAGVTSSFVPNIGTSTDKNVITASEAEKIVKQKNNNVSVLSDYTQRIAVTFNNNVYNCWTIFTNNPNQSVSFNMPYLQHYVSTAGEYVFSVATSSLTASNEETFKPQEYFKDLQPALYTGEVTYGDGTKATITVPVAYNPNDGLYYLADVERYILTAQYKDFCFNDYTINCVTSKDNTGWSNNNLLSYANYIKAYDFYDALGIKSVDGFGTPILMTVGYCDENGNPIDNACYYGVNQGWVCFAVSDINTASDALDVCGHEYTHGVTNNAMRGCPYYNEYGAINEAYSDIMGNLCELLCGDTSDTKWLVAERSGSTFRSMSNPNEYGQPSFVGDVYYVPNVTNVNFEANDNGGVHVNNSLLAGLAYKLDAAGMDKNLQVRMWMTTIEMMTPKSDYDDLHAMLLFAGKTHNIDSKYLTLINQYFEEAGLNGNRESDYLTATRNGYGRLNFTVGENLASLPICVYILTTNGDIATFTFPNSNGLVSALLPEGDYAAVLFAFENNGNSVRYSYYSGQWQAGNNVSAIHVADGQTTTINALGQGTSTTTTSVVEISGELEQYKGNGYSLSIPAGWKVDTSGSYTNTCIRVYDPNNPSLQFFFYGLLAPLFTSSAQRSYWSRFDNTGLWAYAPIIPQQNAVGLLDIWEYTCSFQAYCHGKPLFPYVTNIETQVYKSYTSLYETYLRTIGSAALATCSTEYDSDCEILVGTSVLDGSYFGGGYYYNLPSEIMGTMGIVGTPQDIYDYFDIICECMSTLTFLDNVIDVSWSTCDVGLPNNEELSSIIDTCYESLAKLFVYYHGLSD